jgi:methylglyoxal/glyoxal reductase|eukprot:2119477-Prymnesium_polylepis.2
MRAASGEFELPEVGMGTVCRRSSVCAGLSDTVKTFLALGGSHIDTAPTYGRGASLQQIAKGLRAAGTERQKIWLTSKLPIAAMGFDKTLALVNSTLATLGTKWIDLMLVHRANSLPPHKQNLVTHTMRLETWRALQAAKAAGWIRHAGVSNWDIMYLRELEEAGLPTPFANELEFHPWVSRRQMELIAYCQARGMAP